MSEIKPGGGATPAEPTELEGQTNELWSTGLNLHKAFEAKLIEGVAKEDLIPFKQAFEATVSEPFPRDTRDMGPTNERLTLSWKSQKSGRTSLVMAQYVPTGAPKPRIHLIKRIFWTPDSVCCVGFNTKGVEPGYEHATRMQMYDFYRNPENTSLALYLGLPVARIEITKRSSDPSIPWDEKAHIADILSPNGIQMGVTTHPNGEVFSYLNS